MFATAALVFYYDVYDSCTWLDAGRLTVNLSTDEDSSQSQWLAAGIPIREVENAFEHVLEQKGYGHV